jgi:outer membrane biosynthesis protein TonB
MSDSRHPGSGVTGHARPVRLASLGQVIGDRRRANARLRRSLWVSLLAHALLFLILAPLALPRPEQRAAPVHPPLEVQRLTELPALLRLDPEQLARRLPQPDPVLDQPSPERPPQVAEAPDPERRDPTPQPPVAPDPPVPERNPAQVEFVRSHLEASDQVPDTDRISTQNQQADRERVARARAQVASGAADRGTQAGSPQRATQAGAQPERPAQRTPRAEPHEAEGAPTSAQPMAPRAPRPHQDDQPCGPDAFADGPCDALADARQAFDPQQLAGQDPRDHMEQSPPPLREREGWEPLAVRVTGADIQAQAIPEAPQPDRAASPGPLLAQDAVLLAHPSPSSVRQAQDEAAQRKENPQASQQARAPGSSQPEPATDKRRASSEPQIPAPEPALQFVVEPLELLRQEQEREEDQARSHQQDQRQRRRNTPPGSAKASAASAPGSEAAAGGSVVSPLDPPPVIDVRTVLATRAHPLAGVLQALDDQLREAWEIPFDVRVSGVVGTTGVELLVDNRGRVRDVVTTRPSGHSQLDEAARQAIPSRLEGFGQLLQGEAGWAFPPEGLHIYYEFEYTDSPVAGVL